MILFSYRYMQHLFQLQARILVYSKFITLKNAITYFHIQLKRNLSSCFNICVLLYINVLANYCISFLSVDKIDDVSKLSFLVSRYMSRVDVSFVPSLYCVIDRFISGLQIFDKWIEQRKVAVAFLTLNTCFFLDRGVLELTIVFFSGCNVLHEMLNF